MNSAVPIYAHPDSLNNGMKTFVGTKLVLAKPMTLGEYNDLQGWKIPEGQDPETEGFLIEYIGTEANHKDFAHYISWSPKAAFTESHVQILHGESSNAIMQYFAYAHLPSHLQAVSKVVGLLAQQMDALLPNGPEKSTGLRKLLEAKDCFVRSALPMKK
jgi:hypothetical protein